MRIRIRLSVLAIVLAVAGGGCQASLTPSGAPNASPTPTPTPAPTPTARPTPTPTPAPPDPPDLTAWTAAWTEVRDLPGPGAAVEVRFGPGMALRLVGDDARFEGTAGTERWLRVAWATPGRSGVGWVAESALVREPPGGEAIASLAALDASLAAELGRIGSRVGVIALDLSRGVVYEQNADGRFITASSIKVAIMLTLLDLRERQGRRPSATERAQLGRMIRASSNQDASALWKTVGGYRAIRAFLARAKVAGFTLRAPPSPWGYTLTTPRAMATLLRRLEAGAILTPRDRAYALGLLGSVIPSQRFGVGDGAPDGAVVAMKNGWVPGPDGFWAVNSSGIVTVGGETFIVSVYTRRNPSMQAGFALVGKVAARIEAILAAGIGE